MKLFNKESMEERQAREQQEKEIKDYIKRILETNNMK